MPYADKEKLKEYHRLYHIRNWGERKKKHQEWKKKRRLMLATWLRDYKSTLKCIECNEGHISCIDFHHIDGKDKDEAVANMISQGYSIATIMKEIKKCIVLCKNCHSKLHYIDKIMRA